MTPEINYDYKMIIVLLQRERLYCCNAKHCIVATWNVILLQAARVEDVRKVGEAYRTELKERIERKLETAGEKREAQLSSVQERIRQHVRYFLLFWIFAHTTVSMPFAR